MRNSEVVKLYPRRKQLRAMVVRRMKEYKRAERALALAQSAADTVEKVSDIYKGVALNIYGNPTSHIIINGVGDDKPAWAEIKCRRVWKVCSSNPDREQRLEIWVVVTHEYRSEQEGYEWDFGQNKNKAIRAARDWVAKGKRPWREK